MIDEYLGPIFQDVTYERVDTGPFGDFYGPGWEMYGASKNSDSPIGGIADVEEIQYNGKKSYYYKGDWEQRGYGYGAWNYWRGTDGLLHHDWYVIREASEVELVKDYSQPILTVTDYIPSKYPLDGPKGNYWFERIS